jgi:hypothetical protein
MDPTKNMFGVWIQSIDTVNLDVSKHVLGMDMDVSEKIGVLYPVQPLLSPSMTTWDPAPSFEKLPYTLMIY